MAVGHMTRLCAKFGAHSPEYIVELLCIQEFQEFQEFQKFKAFQAMQKADT